MFIMKQKHDSIVQGLKDQIESYCRGSAEWYKECMILRATVSNLNKKLKEKNMPLNKKGKTIKAAMKKEYGAKKGEKVFYASENKGTIKGVTKKK